MKERKEVRVACSALFARTTLRGEASVLQSSCAVDIRERREREVLRRNLLRAREEIERNVLRFFILA